MRKNKLLICAVSAIMLAAFGCGSSKDTVEDTITVVDSTVKNDSNKAELNTTISFEEKHNEIEQTTVETTETTELTMAVTIVTTDQTIVETTEKIVQIEQATIANKKQPVKQTTTKNNNQNNKFNSVCIRSNYWYGKRNRFYNTHKYSAEHRSRNRTDTTDNCCRKRLNTRHSTQCIGKTW